jgi:alkanesulfonate monooxygenase SsuD/methylene tetrahydromethanopterin reductase-like flavin-dependent oxidoreductase (luciferase family)
VDRLRYESYEPMSVLAAAAAATVNVGLVTMVVIGPLRNTAVLAKQAVTVDAISGGRLTLGLGVGARDDDYEAAGLPPAGRGERLSDQLLDIRSHWERSDSARLSPGPAILVGGSSDAGFLRAARYADGYVHGGGPPRTFERAADRARTAWVDLGRPKAPQLWAQGYFALGDEEAVARGRAYVEDYYSFTGPFASRIAEGMLGTPQAVAQFVRGYAEAGCDELVLLPAVPDLEQIDRLQDALTGA